MPVAESRLPDGSPGGRGLPLDESIPGSMTYAKPEEDIRQDRHGDGSMYRVDDPGDISKDQAFPDERDHRGFQPSFATPGPDVSPKTRYPYRDGIPNAHNARTLTMGPRDAAKELRTLATTLEAPHPDRHAATLALHQILRGMGRKAGARMASTGIYKRTVKEMALELLATDDDDTGRIIAVTADLLESLGIMLYKLGFREASRYIKQADQAVRSDPRGIPED